MLGARLFGLPFLLCVAVCASACTDSDPEDDEVTFDYGGDEVRSAIEGTWEGTAQPAGAGGGEPGTVTLSLAYSAPDVKPLCENRVLAREPGAIGPRCIQASYLNVTGTIAVRWASSAAPSDLAVRGTFHVMSLRFDGRGTLFASLDGQQLNAELANDVLEGSLAGQGNASPLEFKLQRRK